MNHPNLWRVSPWRLRNEVRACQDALRSTCEGPLRVDAFRAPYGNFRSDLRFVVKRFGLKYFVKWDVAPSCEKPDPAAMADFFYTKVSRANPKTAPTRLEKRPRNLSRSLQRG